MSYRSLLVVPALALSTLVAAPGSADVLPPEEMACMERSPGTSCSVDGMDGECVASTCSRLDYARWDGGGSGPPTTEYECAVCETNGGSDEGDGGCATAFGDSDAPAGWAIVGLAALAGVLWRRRRGD